MTDEKLSPPDQPEPLEPPAAEAPASVPPDLPEPPYNPPSGEIRATPDVPERWEQSEEKP